MGSISITKKELVLKVVEKNQSRIYIALDVLNDKIMINGWLKESGFVANDLFKIYDQSSINGYILTDVSRDGMLKGLNFELIKQFMLGTDKNIIVGGGLSKFSDIKFLKNNFSKTNIEGVIAGKSIYSGAINIEEAINFLNNKQH